RKKIGGVRKTGEANLRKRVRKKSLISEELREQFEDAKSLSELFDFVRDFMPAPLPAARNMVPEPGNRDR
ncbi:MAG TPA: hypothetical protein VLY83_05745, partial [Methanoregula sp.]|nr:hypothetical protein [Methanoregula sp.]